MAYLRFDSANFSLGELDPRCYARVDSEVYYKSAKRIRNCVVIPQGGIRHRFGTTYIATLGIATLPENCEIVPLVYDDNLKYVILVQAGQFRIYLEHTPVADVVTSYTAEDIADLRFTQAGNRLIITSENFPQAQLVRSNNGANIITGVDSTNNYINVTTAFSVDFVLPIQFTTSGTLPVTSPQIQLKKTYFMNSKTANSIRVYKTSKDAYNDENYFTITSNGTGVNNVIVQNIWTLSTISFVNKPAYDFDGGYSALTFTPDAISGNNVQITASGVIFTAAMTGGVFRGNGGVLRITGVSGPTIVLGYTIEPFASTSPIQGAVCFLGEPAWSATRGYPRVASFFQQRLVFAGSPQIPNGVWLSVSNDAYDFDDADTLADNAISWYPGGGSISFIRGITSCRTLLIHANTGNFSTPFSSEVPVTPTNFTLTEQNKDGITNIQPIFIDNQLIFVDASGNNVKNMVWEIGESSWVTDNISITSSILTSNPTDLTAFAEQIYTDGSYALFVNDDGTLAIYQTLYKQNIAAWSLSNTRQTYTDGKFVHCAGTQNECWFIAQRYIATAQVGTNITGFSATNATLTSASHGLTIDEANYVTFTTTGTLPVTNTQITTTSYFWARGITTSTFKVYASEDDANDDTNAFTISSSGTNSKLVRWPFESKLYLEQLDFSVGVDCAIKFKNNASATISGLSPLQGETVQIFADDLVWQDQQVVAGSITNTESVNNGYVGLPFTSLFSPLRINNILGDGNNLYKPKHIKNLYINYYQTVGAQVDGFDIPTQSINQVTFGEIPVPSDGIFSITPMGGWDVSEFTIEISQSLPLPMTIIGIGYELEV